MTVKFKIGFQVDAETLFSLIAKFVPIEHLSVEEVFERPPPAPKLTHQPKLAAPGRFAGRKDGSKLKRVRAIDLTKGLNGIILTALSDGEPHTPTELKAIIGKTGYSANSLGSRMAQLIRDGHVVQPEYGLFQRGKTP